MATIAPFTGIRYHRSAAGPLGRLVGPSRDVISEGEKRSFYGKHPHNFCRLLFPEERGALGFRRSARNLERWLACGYLRRDPEPSIYLYEIVYRLPGDITPRKRIGFSSLLRLEEYGSGIVRPHERTFTNVKSRLVESLSCCRANLSQIFCFYDDPRQRIISLLKEAREAAPDAAFEDSDGIWHRVWRISRPEVIRRVVTLAGAMPFYIADGHHRYESCLAYSRHMRSRLGDSPGPHDFTLTHAVAMQDQGITLLPAHRVLKNLEDLDLGRFLRRMEGLFAVEEVPGDGPEGVAALVERMAAHAGRGIAFGMVDPSGKLRLMTLRPGALECFDVHPCKEGLDAEVLSQVVLGRGLGLGRQDRGNEDLFFFQADPHQAAGLVRAGRAQVCFLVNPTRIEQVKAVADAGLFMPRKSSNFYPKVAAGLFVNPMDEAPGQAVPTLAALRAEPEQIAQTVNN